MSIVVITPPAPIMTPDEAKAMVPALRGDDGTYVILLVATVQAEIEPPDSWIGRAFGVQTLEQYEHGCAWHGGSMIRLRCPPVVAVASVTYTDSDGIAQTLAADAYRAVRDGDATYLMPNRCSDWPALSLTPGALRIRYSAGSAAGSPDLLPVKYAVALMVQNLRSMARDDVFLKKEVVEGVGSQEWVVSAAAQQVITGTAERMLSRYRVYL